MNIEQFINDFSDELDDELEALTPDIKFRALNSWDSLTALSVMAMLDNKYKVILSAEAMRKADTLQELYDIVKSQKQ